MTSKITDAIKQLNHSIASLENAMPSMVDTVVDKSQQKDVLRESYLSTTLGILSGVWNLDMSLSEEHARLTGWRYDYEGNPGTAEGNLLVSGLAIRTEDEYATTIKIPYGNENEKPPAYKDPSIQLSVVMGNLRIDFYNLEPAEVFRFIKEHDIIVETPDIDKFILGFKEERMEDLINTKQAVFDAGLIKGKAKPEQAPAREQLFHQPITDDALPIEEDVGVQFNAAEVSALHKHSATAYDYLTNIIKQLDDNPQDVDLVRGMTHSLFRLQTELDNIAVEIGDLDTKDEPIDIGMAGCSYWNLIQAAMQNLDDAIIYIREQQHPSFVEVDFRLTKLSEVLKRCNKEFEVTWMGDKP